MKFLQPFDSIARTVSLPGIILRPIQPSVGNLAVPKQSPDGHSESRCSSGPSVDDFNAKLNFSTPQKRSACVLAESSAPPLKRKKLVLLRKSDTGNDHDDASSAEDGTRQCSNCATNRRTGTILHEKYHALQLQTDKSMDNANNQVASLKRCVDRLAAIRVHAATSKVAELELPLRCSQREVQELKAKHLCAGKSERRASNLESEVARWKGEVVQLKQLLDDQQIHEEALQTAKDKHLAAEAELVNARHREAELTEALKSYAIEIPLNATHARIFNDVMQRKLLQAKADEIEEFTTGEG